MFLRVFLSILFLSILISQPAEACEMCTIPNLGRYKSSIVAETINKKWFFKYLFENQVWKKMSASEAHSLHHNGHHLHVKTNEYFHHFTLGRKLSTDMTVYGEIPYVIRDSIEIHSHNRLGTDERSQGIGDLHLFGDYAFFKKENNKLHLVGGVKFPLGSTEELNSADEKFEAELQPGTGAFDYILGGISEYKGERTKLIGNLAYVYKTEGTQDYRFGDVVSASIFADYRLNPDSQSWIAEAGLSGNVQYEQKHEEGNAEVADSGGTTFLLGPTVSLKDGESLAFNSSIMFPVYQELGGVHQEVDFTWTLGGQLQF